MPCCFGSFSVVRPARDLRAAADRPLVRPCLPVAWSTRPAAEGRRKSWSPSASAAGDRSCSRCDGARDRQLSKQGATYSPRDKTLP